MNTDLLSTISGLIDNAKYCNDKGVRKEILLLAQKHLDAVIGKSTKTVECVKSIYENDGFVPAIKEWRAISNKGLKEAKEDVEQASDDGKWRNRLIGKSMKIISANNYFHGHSCTVVYVNNRTNGYCTIVLHRDGCEYVFPVTSLKETV